MSKHLQCLLAATLCTLLVTGCGAPKPPMPSGERIAVNGQPIERQTVKHNYSFEAEIENTELHAQPVAKPASTEAWK